MEDEREVLSLLGRDRRLFGDDLAAAEEDLSRRVADGAFLVLGGAGSIGREVVKELFRRQPRRLDVVDVSENNLAELVRDLRSSIGYTEGEFRTLPLDVGGPEFDAFLDAAGPYDQVLNLSALKHVRSEKDPFTLMRMLQVNVLATERSLGWAAAGGARRYFAVSSDKAANPANAMGASKRAMELCLVRAGSAVEVASARFANVAFSDGSLLDAFRHRLAKRQPLAAPEDVRRYFITASEAAVLCLLAALDGGNRESYIPLAGRELRPQGFRGLAEGFLRGQGYEAHPCAGEEEARARVEELAAAGRWPCYFFTSDTTGEKEVEEFRMQGETVDRERYREIGVIRWPALADEAPLDAFLETVGGLLAAGRWSRAELIDSLRQLLPEFRHRETGRFLDGRM